MTPHRMRERIEDEFFDKPHWFTGERRLKAAIPEIIDGLERLVEQLIAEAKMGDES